MINKEVYPLLPARNVTLLEELEMLNYSSVSQGLPQALIVREDRKNRSGYHLISHEHAHILCDATAFFLSPLL